MEKHPVMEVVIIWPTQSLKSYSQDICQKKPMIVNIVIT